jgi:putative glutamine amidotransferase
VASNGSRPLIGISCYLEQARFGAWDVPAALLAGTYLDCVVAAGGTPVLLPPVGEWGVAEVSRLDGLILAGGPDIGSRPERDTAELELLNAARQTGTPVLGVCRGMQLINTALGGTLHQHLDLPEHLPTPGTFGRVEIKVTPQSRLASIIGEQVTVSCHHHQGVDGLGEGLVPVGWAPDGTVEAIELPGDEFLVGVQWHPEEDTVDRRLFQALVAAA